jgi:hypothetical protein
MGFYDKNQNLTKIIWPGGRISFLDKNEELTKTIYPDGTIVKRNI